MLGGGLLAIGIGEQMCRLWNKTRVIEVSHVGKQRIFKDGQTGPAVIPISDEDAPLVVASQAGDASAFEQLVSRYDRKLFRIAYHLVRNADDARMWCRILSLRFFRILAGFRSQSKFSTWLCRIVVNQSLMEVRKQHTKPALVDLLADGNEEEDRLPMECRTPIHRPQASGPVGDRPEVVA